MHISRPWVGSNHQPSGIVAYRVLAVTAERASQLRHRGLSKSGNIMRNMEYNVKGGTFKEFSIQIYP